MIKLNFKTDRQRLEFESGNVNTRLVNIVKFGMEFLSLEYPDIDYTLVLTDIKRETKEQDAIYLNHKDKTVAEKYKKKPWLSTHQFWRGIDIRVNDMPKGMAEKLTNFFNQITYDKLRLKKKTAILHDVGTGSHIHCQTM